MIHHISTRLVQVEIAVPGAHRPSQIDQTQAMGPNWAKESNVPTQQLHKKRRERGPENKCPRSYFNHWRTKNRSQYQVTPTTFQ